MFLVKTSPVNANFLSAILRQNGVIRNKQIFRKFFISTISPSNLPGNFYDEINTRFQHHIILYPPFQFRVKNGFFQCLPYFFEGVGLFT